MPLIIHVVTGGTHDAQSVSVSRAIGQAYGQASVTLTTNPGASIGGSVAVWVGFGSTEQIFGGVVAGITTNLDGRTTLECRDVLERMGFPWGGSAREYFSLGTASFDDANIIRNLLEAYAIPNTQASIESSEAGELAAIQPIRLEPGDTPWNLIREMDTIAGYATCCRGNGAVYRRSLETGAGGDATYGTGGIISGSRTQTRDGVKNRCQVVGLEYVGTAVAGTAETSNGAVPDPPGYITRDIRSNMIETNGAAGSAADRHIARYGAVRDEVQMVVPGPSAADVFDSVTVSAMSVSQAYQVTGVSHEAGPGGWTATIKGARYGS
jgi:hypothetical protein